MQKEGWITPGHEETSARDGHVHYHHCGDGFTGVLRLTKFCTLNIYCLQCTNYTLINLYKKMMLIKQKYRYCDINICIEGPSYQILGGVSLGNEEKEAGKKRKSKYTNPWKVLHYVFYILKF